MNRLFLMAAAVVVATSCAAESKPSEKSIAVRTSVAKSVEGGGVKEFSFIAKPQHTTNLSFRVGGTIEQFDSYAGSHFKRGEKIAALDDRDFVVGKERAEGFYGQAKAEWERIKTLYEKNNVSASAYDKAYADYVAAKTAYAMAKNELHDTRLVAPFNGYVDRVFVEQYQDVRAGEPIVTLVDIDKLRIEVYVGQSIAVKAREIKEVKLRFDENPDKVYRAKVADISKSTTDNNLSYLLTALLPNGDSALLPGMSGEVFFDSEKSDPVIVVPQTALSHRPTDGDYVWCVDSVGGTVSKRVVTLGRTLPNGYVEIESNLQEGEQVATSGLRFLSDGMKVTVAK